MQSVIEICAVDFFYKHSFQKSKQVLKDLSLSVARGATVGFLGANGAGKTTTIKILLGLLTPQQGSVSVLGEMAGSIQARRKIGYLCELSYFYWYLTAEEILWMYANLFGLDRITAKQRIDYLLELVGLDQARKRLIKYYSKGMCHRVGLAQALINDPEVLILDEPTAGLDPLGREKVAEIIKGLQAQGKSVFFSSHELSQVELLCDKVAIIKEGRLVCYQNLADILNSVARRYQEDVPNKLERYFLDLIGKNQ